MLFLPVHQFAQNIDIHHIYRNVLINIIIAERLFVNRKAVLGQTNLSENFTGRDLRPVLSEFIFY